MGVWRFRISLLQEFYQKYRAALLRKMVAQVRFADEGANVFTRRGLEVVKFSFCPSIITGIKPGHYYRSRGGNGFPLLGGA